MCTAKPSPGPWYSQPSAGHDIHGQSLIYGPDGKTIAVVYDGDSNAELIAAAPELLEALRECLTDPAATAAKSHDMAMRRLAYLSDIAERAIRKATGE